MALRRKGLGCGLVSFSWSFFFFELRWIQTGLGCNAVHHCGSDDGWFRLVAASHASGDDRRLVLIPAIEYHGALTAAARWKQRDNDLRSACQLLSVVPVGGKLERSSVLMVGCLASCCLAH